MINRRLLLMPFLLSIILAGGLLPIRAAAGARYDIGAPVLTGQPSHTSRRYNTVIAQKAAQYGALMVDFYQTTIFTDLATLANDGNHPNAAGYDIAAGRWYDTLKPLLGG